MLKSQAKAKIRKRQNPRQNPFVRMDINKELRRLDKMLEQLRVDHEQFFLGFAPYLPDQLHAEVKRLMRRIRKAPFKRVVARYRLRVLESRYHTYHDYWQRVLREKEGGTYSKDVFKANLRERQLNQDRAAQTQKGAISKEMENLFKCYKLTLERETGKKQNLDFEVFKKTLMQKAKAHAQQTGVKKFSFQVVVRDGKVTLRAKTGGEGSKRAGNPSS
ncbi:MAG: hypothetical protein GX589_11155 [Deltaproteobacteria bacterium]|nr:hypothetical protein [Deltaproteobacteria bacterium]